jgi:hypothetical protein
LRSPFFGNEEFSLAKHFYFGERFTFEIKMDYANILNRMRVCGLDNNVNDGAKNFGLVNPNGNGGSNPCQAIGPRQGQIFLKLKF